MKNITKYNNELPADEVPVSQSEKSLRIFERIYKKKYESIDQVSLKEIEMILSSPETIEIPAKNIAIEISK